MPEYEEVPAPSATVAALVLNASILCVIKELVDPDLFAVLQRNAEKWCQQAPNPQMGREALAAVRWVFSIAEENRGPQLRLV